MYHPQDTIATTTLKRTGQALSGLAVWPVAEPAPARTLVDILEATVQCYPDAPALEADGVVLTYRELREATGVLAAKLRGHGVGPGDRIGVRVPSGTMDLYVAILGALRAGAAYVPVDVDDPDERAEMIWQDAAVCAVIGEGCRILPGPGTAGRRPGPPSVQDDAWIIFTSGTTGRPKGVAVGHRAAAAFVDAEARLFLQDDPLRPGRKPRAGRALGGLRRLLRGDVARLAARRVPRPRSQVPGGNGFYTDLGPWLIQRGITVVSTVPTLAALWPAETLERIRLLIVGGEACPAELVERLDVPEREFWNTYGPTETTVVACAALMRAGRPVRIGAPLDGWELAVVDEQGRPVAWGETGELLIGGVGTARYLDPVKDAGKFAPHPALGRRRVYRSGDLVRADLDGLVFVGRADEQIKLGGRRIELGEIDAALLARPGVRAAAAAVKDTAAGGQVLVGYLVPDRTTSASRGTGLDRNAAKELLLQRLPPAMIPVLAVVDELPTRTSRPRSIARPCRGRCPNTRLPCRARPALDGTQGWLAEQWQRQLGVPIEADSDFFALGGSSLTAARLIAVLRESYPTLAVTDLYHNSRLPDLAAFLDGAAARGVPETAAPAARRRAARPASRLA